MFNILIAEDDKHMRDLIKTILTQAGYNCKTACDGAEALLVMENSHIDLAVVDIMMPNMDGYEFTKTLRDGLCEIPVLMVTAKISHNDKKQGFLSGIDDFLAKPFDDEELLWRVKALLRRSKIAFEKVVTIGSTVLDYASLTAKVDGQEVELTPKEFLLLYKLLSYPNQLFTKRQIMDEIWDFDTESDEHTVEVHINRLREKFKDNKDFSIKTIRGFGYMGINDYEKA
ncbi:MAG: response regulator transcription factor [Eubacteriales bacterium]|nr:response regulator transcription factor [Eubacteriales bacterium]